MSKEDLEGKLEREHQWKKYPITQAGVMEDLVLKYITSPKEDRKKKRTKMQEKIETAVTGKGLIEDEELNKKQTYEEQFYEGHAAQGGRIVEVNSHITKKGKNKGKLIHFDEPADGEYIWVVDEKGEFIVGNREKFLHDMPQMPRNKYSKRTK